jgi:hypothetical protein
MGIEPAFEVRLDNLEVGRKVKVARRKKRMVADMQYLPPGVV